MRRRHPILRAIVYLAALGFFVIVAAALAAYVYPEGMVGENAVAVVLVEGTIHDSKETVEALDRVAKNEAIHAVVMRIDSPGGGVAPSQEIHDAVMRLREKKPVIASFGNMAASGGYYIAAACDWIVSNPGTLTGSIGVILQSGNLEELLRKLGVEGITVKAGKFKDVGSPLRSMTPEEHELLQALLDNVHQQFVSAVVKGRKLPVEEVRKIADGRVYSGEQALQLKLVDQLGGLREALDAAAERAGIEGEPNPVEIRSQETTWWWRRMMGALGRIPVGITGLQFRYAGPGGGAPG